MPPPTHSRAQNVWGWTLEELTLILLRQFRTLFAEKETPLSDSQMKALAQRAQQRALNEGDALVTTALSRITAESTELLASWGYTFAQSLITSMTEIAGWDTTADFLSRANEKINAELRISAGSALAVLLGDLTQVAAVMTSFTHGMSDPEDVDALIARRALAFAAGIDPRTGDFATRIEAWAASIAAARDSST